MDGASILELDKREHENSANHHQNTDRVLNGFCTPPIHSLTLLNPSNTKRAPLAKPSSRLKIS